MNRKWNFIVTSCGPRSVAWSWTRCCDGVAVQDSNGRFDDFVGCVFDAGLNGYIRGDAFEVIEDRRKSRRYLATALEF